MLISLPVLTLKVNPSLWHMERRHRVAGVYELITELRPVVAMFLRFGGINYDDDPVAGGKLDSFIRRVQAILARYDGALLQLTIGDKGSYLYAAFGAPTAHEDDARRAAHAALACLALPDELSFLQPLRSAAAVVCCAWAPTVARVAAPMVRWAMMSTWRRGSWGGPRPARC
jgi:hypothetical protein